jgi:hypothetical protein
MSDFQPRTIETQEADPAVESSHQHDNPDGIVKQGGGMLTSYEIASYFDANPQDYSATDKIDHMVGQMAEMGFTGTDALLFIQNIENRMSQPPIGTDRLNHFWNYFKLMLASNDINKRKKLYEQ